MAAWIWKLLLAVSMALVAVSGARAADTILVNGRIVTLDARSNIAEAMAITGDRIAAVGTTAAISAASDARTRRIDLGGRTVIPGLIDSHIHAIRAGHRASTEVSWIGLTSLAEALERLRAAARSAPQTQWIIVGGGWTPGQFDERRRPALAEILEAAPHHAVYIQMFYRALLINAAGRARLGIAGDDDLTEGLTAERDTSGAPTGWIDGTSPAVTALYDRLPKPSLDQAMAGTKDFFRTLNRFGITGVIDPGGHNLQPDDYEALLRLWRAGGLTLRVAYSISAPRPGTAPQDLQALTRFLPMGTGDGMLRFNGVGERATWGLFNNDAPSELQKQEFLAVARWAAERDMTLTAHWNNDRSVHHLLDMFEAVDREHKIGDLRWSIAHLHDASPASLERMKALGVGWLMQNGLYFATPSFLVARGSTMNTSPPIASARRLGVAVGGGTDAHRVMGYNPFVSLKWMTDGRTIEGLPTRGLTELVTREEALRIYTQGSAWFAFAEHERGTLETGRLADLAVLDGDYLTVPAADLARLQSLLTMVGGRVVYAAGPFSSEAPP